MRKSWRDIARAAINQAIANTPTQPTEGYLARVKVAINAAYPFGMRRGAPCRIWLEERAAAFYDLGIIQMPPKKRFSKAKSPPKQDLVVPGQLSLLEIVPATPAGHGKDPSRIQLPLTLHDRPNSH